MPATSRGPSVMGADASPPCAVPDDDEGPGPRTGPFDAVVPPTGFEPALPP